MLANLMKLGSLFTMLSVPFTQNVATDRPSNMNNTSKSTIYDFKMKGLDGKEIDLAQYKGKKVVILNTASACGYTPQYADWQKFHVANAGKVVVLGFPCNSCPRRYCSGLTWLYLLAFLPGWRCLSLTSALVLV